MSGQISSYVKDPGSGIYHAFSHAEFSAETEQDGDWVAVPDCAQGAYGLIPFKATLADGEALTLDANFQDAMDGTGTLAADYKALLADGSDGAGRYSYISHKLAEGPTGGGTVSGVAKVRLPDIRSHRGALRLQVTLVTAAAGTFTSAPVLGFGGTVTQPTPNVNLNE